MPGMRPRSPGGADCESWFAERGGSVKRKVTANQPLYDGRGIPPEVSIGDEVSDWVGYVRKHYAGEW